MFVIPSLYIQDQKIVSWYKGQPEQQKKIYYKDPVHLSKLFESEGAERLQIIDLSGSLEGQLVHKALIKRICHALEGEVQVGGGIRSMGEVEAAFEAGAARVLLGVSAIEILREALDKYGPDKIILGIKGRHNKVETEYTLEGKNPKVTDLAKKIQEIGIKQIVYKDLETEGALYHPNFDMIDKLIYETGGEVEIYSSGGTSDEYDLKLLKETGAAGVIIGRALMENHLDFKKLVERYGS